MTRKLTSSELALLRDILTAEWRELAYERLLTFLPKDEIEFLVTEGYIERTEFIHKIEARRRTGSYIRTTQKGRLAAIGMLSLWQEPSHEKLVRIDPKGQEQP